MSGARSLIASFNEIKKTESKSVAHFTPSLIGMFGSIGIFDAFLMEVDASLAAGQASVSLKKRAANLIGTFIPQVADYNNIKNLSATTVSAEALKNISADSLESRRKGIEIILAALIVILKEVESLS